MKISKLIVDVKLLERVNTYHHIDNFITSYGVGVRDENGFVKNRLRTIFTAFQVEVVPAEKMRSVPNATLSFPILDRQSGARYQLIVGNKKPVVKNSQINLI